MKDRDAYGVVVSNHLAHFPRILGTRRSLSLCFALNSQHTHPTIDCSPSSIQFR